MDTGGHHRYGPVFWSCVEHPSRGEELKQSTQLATRWPQDFTYCWQRSSEVPGSVPPRAGWWH